MEGSKLYFLLPVYAALLFLLPAVVPTPNIIELSYVFDKSTPTNPKLSKFNHRVVKRGLNKFGTWVEMFDFSASEHTGTHMDAPVHFSKGGQTIDEISPYKLYRVPGVKIDVRSKVEQSGNSNYEIRPTDIQEWIQIYGDLPDGCVILFQTGWGENAFNPLTYSGMDQFGKFNFPSIGSEAAEWIVRYRNTSNILSPGIAGVGIDTMSLDVGQSVRYPSHIILLGGGIYGIENVANLDQLPPRGFTLTMLPIRIGQGSGAPTRIIAEIEGQSFSEALTAASSSSRLLNSVMVALNTTFWLLMCYVISV